MTTLSEDGPFDCQSCGACCVEAGRVEVRPDEEIPRRLLDQRPGHETRIMARHMGGRCKALQGVIGCQVGCGIYANRPSVCQRFQAGSEGCRAARQTARYKMDHPGRPRGYGVDWLETI